MAIILAVIKWIGILIGIVLGIAVVLAACVVWVPVRYRAEAVLPEQGEKKYAFSVSFLFHLISIKKKLDSEKVRIRIGFITVKSKEEKEKKETTEKKKTTSQKSEKKGEKVPEEQTQQKVPPRKKRTKKRFSFPGVSGIINFITDENKRVIRIIWRECKGLFHQLAPRRIWCDLVCGLEDPCYTGLLFGALALFPVVYRKEVHIVPDFERKMFMGRGKIKGNIQVFYLLKMAVRLYRNQEIMNFYKRMKNK